MHTQSPQGPIVAGMKFPAMTSSMDMVLGDPIHARPEQLVRVERASMMSSNYAFLGAGTGQRYEWRRTHQTELGGSMLSSHDFKLVAARNSSKILAVYIMHGVFGAEGQAHIDFMVELGNDLELQAMTSILAMIKQRTGGSSGAGAGGGGGLSC